MSQAEAERKVTDFVLQDWQLTNLPMPQDFTYTMTRVDLYGDRIQESWVFYNHPMSCGTRGCSVFLLDLRCAAACGRCNCIAFVPEAGQETNGGWRDIMLNNATTFPFIGGHYVDGSWN